MKQHLQRHMRLSLWVIVVVALALGLVGQTTARGSQHSDAADEGGLHFIWEFYPKSFREARDKATLIVLADVVAVERGPDIVVPVKGLPNDEDRVPMQHITVKVAKTYQGQAAPGQTVTLAQTGGGTIGFSEDSPTYKVGERYVLLLRPGRPNMYRIISPEGRYRITTQGLVEPMKVADPNNPALADLRGGKPLVVLEQLLTLP